MTTLDPISYTPFLDIARTPALSLSEEQRQKIIAEYASLSDKIGKTAEQTLRSLSDQLLANIHNLPEVRSRIFFWLDRKIDEIHLMEEFLTTRAALRQQDDPKTAKKDVDIALLITQSDELLARICSLRDAPSPTKLSGECAGLENPNKKCFLNSGLKGLWTSAAFRKFLSTKSGPTAAALTDLFEQLDKSAPDEIIPHSHPAIQKLLTILADKHPEAKTCQCDVSDLYGWIFEELLLKDETLLSYTMTKERPEELVQGITVPSIEIPEKTKTNVFFVQLPPAGKIELQQLVQEREIIEPLDKESIRKSEHNEKIDKDLLEEALKDLPAEVAVKQHIRFDKAPPFLFIQLVASRREEPGTVDSKLKDLSAEEKKMISETVKTETIKVRPKVTFSDTLTINGADAEVPYHLEGIIVHTGKGVNSGHYRTFLSTSKRGHLVEHDDSRVGVRALSSEILDLLANNAHLFIYERADEAPAAH